MPGTPKANVVILGGGTVGMNACKIAVGMGANVTGIDPSERNIAIAKGHAEPQGLVIDYRAQRVEELASAGESFDIVACLEVVEHVPDVGQFIAECARVVRPGGLVVFSTLNRTFKSWALAIVGAEYVLGWLPRGTHQWDRFVTPDEMTAYATAARLSAPRFEGITYNPFQDQWSLAPDTGVNYLVSMTKTEQT